uniref:Uncharacterized protein n=1 Tax=Triticum urartu TaxID=4572 RepID=A0A8R7QAA9_TRIUA
MRRLFRWSTSNEEERRSGAEVPPEGIQIRRRWHGLWRWARRGRWRGSCGWPGRRGRGRRRPGRGPGPPGRG